MKTQKILVLVFLTLISLMSANARAVHEVVKDDLLITRAMIAANRTQIVLNTLELTDEKIKAFSPMYLDYWEEMNLINDRLATLILDYADNFENLTDEKALLMLDESLDIQEKKIALKKKFVSKFKSVLTPKKLVQYYQTENKLDAIIMMELAAGVPLVK